MSGQYCIGVMSGTSIDAIDAVLIELNQNNIRFIDHHTVPWTDGIRQRLLKLSQPGNNEIDRLGVLDQECAEQFAICINGLLERSGISPERITAIGSHGQTIRHRPDLSHPFTLQIGDPNRIAEMTGITVVADFRRRDMAANGEGAPLVPAFHEAMLRSTSENRVILNLGGIANITVLPKATTMACSGFDTGPANCLLDRWYQRYHNGLFDLNGDWARKGHIDQRLLKQLLAHPYFQRLPPKSTGTETFNLDCLDSLLSTALSVEPTDIQATLSLLTVESIARAIERWAPETERIIVCGGGVHNIAMMEELVRRLPKIRFDSSSDHGMDPQHVEAMAFAWLAARTINRQTGNLPAVTGAKHRVILGGIYPA